MLHLLAQAGQASPGWGCAAGCSSAEYDSSSSAITITCSPAGAHSAVGEGRGAPGNGMHRLSDGRPRPIRYSRLLDCRCLTASTMHAICGRGHDQGRDPGLGKIAQLLVGCAKPGYSLAAEVPVCGDTPSKAPLRAAQEPI